MQFTNPQAVDDLVKQVAPLCEGKPIVDCGEALLLIVAHLVAAGLDHRDDAVFINRIYESLANVVRSHVKRGQLQ